MWILGINSAYHESSVCLIEDGQMVAAAEEERFNRVKHAKTSSVDNPDDLPVHALEFCLKEAGIELEDVDHIGFSFNPEKRLRNIETGERVIEGDWGSRTGEETFYARLLMIPKKVSEMAGTDVSPKWHWIDHHLCHAASAYFVSPFEESAVLSVDGIGEFTTTFLGYGRGNAISTIREIEYPNSLGFVWEKISEFLGFTEHDGAKVMGLSAYGSASRYMDTFRTFLMPQDGYFTIDNRFLNFRWRDFSTLEELFGVYGGRGIEIGKDHMDIAAGLQRITEVLLLNLAHSLYEQAQSKNLCLAGGVALNCVANRALQEKGPFEHVFIQPAAHDAGTAIGAAFYIWHQMLDKPRTYVMDSTYWGPGYTEKDVETISCKRGLGYVYVRNIEQVTAKLVSDGNIVGWFQGKMEFGPRALGNRSILGDPRRPEIKDILNDKIKHREWFRPFAPSVLEEKAAEWFDILEKSLSSRAMLFAYSVREDKRALIPAVTHVNGTSRIQTVTEQLNPRYYRLIQEYEKLTGLPLILNTSLNTKGEPIVCSPEDAIEALLTTDMDYLAMEKYLMWNPHGTLGERIAQKVASLEASLDFPLDVSLEDYITSRR